jgi:hypothetical protein
MSDTTTFYKKEEDGSYTPIQEYDPTFMYSLPFGIHMVVCEEGSKIRYDNIDPDHITLWASAYLLRNKLEKVVESIYKPGVIPECETKDQKEAFAALEKAFGKDSFELQFPSNREVSDKLAELMVELVDELIGDNNTLQKSWENFNIAVKLIK